MEECCSNAVVYCVICQSKSNRMSFQLVNKAIVNKNAAMHHWDPPTSNVCLSQRFLSLAILHSVEQFCSRFDWKQAAISLLVCCSAALLLSGINLLWLSFLFLPLSLSTSPLGVLLYKFALPFNFFKRNMLIRTLQERKSIEARRAYTMNTNH